MGSRGEVLWRQMATKPTYGLISKAKEIMVKRFCCPQQNQSRAQHGSTKRHPERKTLKRHNTYVDIILWRYKICCCFVVTHAHKQEGAVRGRRRGEQNPPTTNYKMWETMMDILCHHTTPFGRSSSTRVTFYYNTHHHHRSLFSVIIIVVVAARCTTFEGIFPKPTLFFGPKKRRTPKTKFFLLLLVALATS